MAGLLWRTEVGGASGMGPRKRCLRETAAWELGGGEAGGGVGSVCVRPRLWLLEGGRGRVDAAFLPTVSGRLCTAACGDGIVAEGMADLKVWSLNASAGLGL